jgi:hypothetical protein
MLKVDHVLAMYLIDLSETVIVNFYKVAAVLVNTIRNCVNDLAWEHLANYKLLCDFDN